MEKFFFSSSHRTRGAYKNLNLHRYIKNIGIFFLQSRYILNVIHISLQIIRLSVERMKKKQVSEKEVGWGLDLQGGL